MCQNARTNEGKLIELGLENGPYNLINFCRESHHCDALNLLDLLICIVLKSALCSLDI